MRGTGVGVFAAVGGAGGASRAATRTEPDARVGAKHHYFLELQWQGRGGRFRHVALSRPAVRRLLGTLGVVALVAVVGVASVGSNRAPSTADLDALLGRNAELKAQQAALHQSAMVLTEQLYERVELGRKLAWMNDAPIQAWEAECPRPPARDAGTEALLAWLSDQSVRLESLGAELTAGMDGPSASRRPSVTSPPREATVTLHGAAAPHSAGMGSAQPDRAAPPEH